MRHAVQTALVVTALALPASARAQDADRPPVPLSQRGTVSQRVGYTDIHITYNRPVARGRTLFGGIVEWERVWTPGADSATTITFSSDVVLEGARIPAGRYTLWIVPKSQGPWTVIVSAAVDIFHAPYPGEEHDVVRFTVTPEHGSHMEVLALYFPIVKRNAAVLRVHWGDTIIPLRIETTDQD